MLTSSVVTVSQWPRSVGFGSVLGKKLRFQFCMVQFSDQHQNQCRHPTITSSQGCFIAHDKCLRWPPAKCKPVGWRWIAEKKTAREQKREQMNQLAKHDSMHVWVITTDLLCL